MIGKDNRVLEIAGEKDGKGVSLGGGVDNTPSLVAYTITLETPVEGFESILIKRSLVGKIKKCAREAGWMRDAALGDFNKVKHYFAEPDWEGEKAYMILEDMRKTAIRLD